MDCWLLDIQLLMHGVDRGGYRKAPVGKRGEDEFEAWLDTKPEQNASIIAAY